AMRALEFERPTYYIERSLAEALIRTDVPLDLQVEDIHWIYPQLRIYLPNDLIAINRNGIRNPAMFIDICKGEVGTSYQMPSIFRSELRSIGGWYFPEHKVPEDSFIMTTFLHFDCDEGNINYAVTSPWKGETLRKLIDIGNTLDLMGGLVSDEADHEFMSRVTCFALNVLLRLSSLPAAEQEALKQTKTIRKPRHEGKRSIVGLYAAKIIGMGEIPKLVVSHEKIEPT